MSNQDPSLRELADARGLLLGAAAYEDPFFELEQHRRVLAEQFNALTPSRSMKMDATQPERGRFAFDRPDRLIAFAQAHDMQTRGHTLVWHHPRALPDWFKARDWSRSEALDLMASHIEHVAGHFRGQLYAWDVVNEGVEEEHFWRTESPWFKAIGEDYVDHAFRFARQADPDVALFYNDYAMDLPNTKADHAYDLVRGMLDRDVPIDGVGLQYHLKLEDAYAIEQVAANIQRFNDLGLTVHLTEMDVWLRLDGQGPPINEQLATQAKVYREAVEVALAAEDCPVLVLWGYTDAVSWVPKFTDGAYGGALVFDEAYRAKPAWTAMADALRA